MGKLCVTVAELELESLHSQTTWTIFMFRHHLQYDTLELARLRLFHLDHLTHFDERLF
jgi:hypothetical protein